MKKFILSSVVAFAVVLGAFASTAQAYNFASDLTVGSTGADVVALQTALVNGGYLVMPAGTAMGYFGQVTKTAVAKYQASVGLPSTGFFGPMTRAKLSSGSVVSTVPSTGVTSTVAGCTPGAMFSSTTGQKCNGSTTTISTSGEEGELDNFDEIGGVESTLDEGDEDVEVLGFEFEAKDSDMLVERVDVDFTIGSGGSSKLDDYITGVKLVLDGKEIASADVDEADEDNDVWSFRFKGLKGVVSEDETAELYVTVDAVSNLDTDDADVSLTVEIPADGIRAVDGAGISDTYVSADELEESFDMDSVTAGDLDITEADESPKAATVKVDDEDSTKDVTLLVFELEADNQDIDITDLPVGLGSTGATVYEVIKSVKLVQGSKTLDTVSIPSSASGNYYRALFEDVDVTIEDGDTETFKVIAEINDIEGNFTAGDSVTASSTEVTTGWDVEDSEGDDVTPNGTADGEAQTFRSEGISVVFKAEDSSIEDSDTNSEDRGVFTIDYEVEAFEETAYIELGTSSRATAENNTGANYVIEDTSNNIISSGTTTVDLSLLSGGSVDSNNFVRINAGSKATFRLKVWFDPAAAAVARLQLYSVNYAATAVDATTQEVVAPANDFDTGSESINN